MDETTNELHDPWLVAVWPGMGNVAVGAGGYLVNKLGARLAHVLSSRDFFEIRQVEVKGGLARIGRLPRNLFFEWKDPEGRHDLLIFLAEAQPPHEHRQGVPVHRGEGEIRERPLGRGEEARPGGRNYRLRPRTYVPPRKRTGPALGLVFSCCQALV